MEENRRSVFASELKDRAVAASLAYRRLEAASAIHPPAKPNPPEEEKQKEFLRLAIIQESARAVVLGVAGIARVFDPHPQGTEEFKSRCRARDKELRDEFGIQPDSPLLLRDVRDAFEHLDERIDEWVDRNPKWTMGVWAFVNASPDPFQNFEPLIRYNARTFDMAILGSSCNLKQMAEAVRILLSRLERVQTSVTTLRFDSPGAPTESIVLTRPLGTNKPVAEPPPERAGKNRAVQWHPRGRQLRKKVAGTRTIAKR